MQQKNFLLFIILAVLILTGWTWLQDKLWPRKVHEEEKSTPSAASAWKKLPPRTKAELETAMLVGTSASGLLGPLDSVARLAAVDPFGLGIAAFEAMPRSLRPDEVQDLRKVLAFACPDNALADLILAAAQAPYVARAQKAMARPHTVQLGDEAKGYYLTAKLTTLGGGVESVTLTKFKAANREGLPVYKTAADGTKVAVPLELVQEDPYLPSFLLYHYAAESTESDLRLRHPVVTLGETTWKLEESSEKAEEQEVRFSAAVPGYDHLTITRIYTLGRHDYHIGLTVEIKDTRRETGADKKERLFRYQLAGAHGLPIEGEWYTYTYRNALIGELDSSGGLWRTMEDSRQISFAEGGSAVPSGARGGTFIQYAGVQNQYFASVIAVDDKQPSAEQGGVTPKEVLAWARPTLETIERRVRIRSFNPVKGEMKVIPMDKTGGEMTVILVPRALQQLQGMDLKDGEDIFLNCYVREDDLLVGTALRRGTVAKPFLDDVTVRVVSEPIALKPGDVRSHRYMLYHGPVKVRLLGYGDYHRPAADAELVGRYADTLHLNTLTDYRSAGPFGWFAQKIMVTQLLIACTNFMHWLLHLLQSVVVNEGLTIILLTVIVRGLMFPISRKQAQMSMKMAELGPEMKKVQEKYKNDPQAKTAAVMELYRKHNVNPLGGCLPLLLQMPIFLGLYYALQESIAFRLAPFLWIQNLAAPDMLIWWGEKIPWISDPDSQGGFLYLGPYFNLLPVLAVAFMIVQQKIMMPPPADEQQAMQQKMMKYMMIFFGLMFYKVAAGLCMYFIASSLWGLAERKLLPKKTAVPSDQPPPSGKGGGGGGPGNGPPGGGKGPGGRGKTRPVRRAAAEDTRFQKMKDWWIEILKQARKK